MVVSYGSDGRKESRAVTVEEEAVLRAEVEAQHEADVDRLWAGFAEYMKPWWRKVIDRFRRINR